MFNRKLNNEQLILLEKVKVDYFTNPIIQIKIDVEGQTLDENKNFLIGCFAGPSCEIENLFHEMGHFAQREVKKLKQRPYAGWGFKYGKKWRALGQSGYEPNTCQSTIREIQVWAYQLSLQNYYGLKTDLVYMVEAITYVNSFFLYHPGKTEKEKIALACQEVEELSKTKFNMSSFDLNWNHRIKLLSK